MRRRAFLRGLALGGAAVASGCVRAEAQTSPSPSASPSAFASITPPTTPSPAPTVGPPDWNALRTALRDGLVRSGDPTYDAARVSYNTRFDGVRPQAVARCATTEDVRECVRFARAYGIPLALRSGGHSYAGWSTGEGLVVDVGRMSAIDGQSDRVTVGAGARLIDLYDAVAARGQGVPAGSCASVGVTGLTLGGGMGVLSRAWGLTCDELVAGAGARIYREQGVRTYRDVMLLEAGCLGRSIEQCHLVATTPAGVLGRETYVAKSAVAKQPLPDAAIAALVGAIESIAGRQGVGGGAVLLDSLGGAVSRVAPSATAFAHRDAFAVAQFIASWNAAGPASVADDMQTWLRDLYAAGRPLIGRGAYLNYADAELPDWEDAYWGANYPRLRQVKARYDPDRVFDFAQAVRP